MQANERLIEIYQYTVSQLKAVVEKFGITQDELHIAGDFLNRAGKENVCRSLVDVTLAMASMDATVRLKYGTRPSIEGPYYGTHPVRSDGNLIDEPKTDDDVVLHISGIVSDASTGLPINGAHVDFWQADSHGKYDLNGSNLRGVVITDSAGRYRTTTLVPKSYSEHDHDQIGELFCAMGRPCSRAAHIHVRVSSLGEVRLTTQLFIPDSPYLDSDYVEGAVTPDLILTLEPEVGSGSDGAPAAFTAKFDFVVPNTSLIGTS